SPSARPSRAPPGIPRACRSHSTAPSSRRDPSIRPSEPSTAGRTPSPCSSVLLLSAHGRRNREVQRLPDEFCQLAQLDLTLVARGLDRVLVHRHVLWTADDEVVDTPQRNRLVDPLLARPGRVVTLELRHPDTS